MVERKIQRTEEILRFRVGRYLNAHKWGIELKNTLRKLESHGCSAYIVGGFLRDLMLDGLTANPRDIDVVFDRISADKVEFLFWNQKERKNRFGGLRLKFGDCPLDLWSLKDTWAFRSGKIKQVNVSTFPQTTFLNLDAIAFRWNDNCNGEIFSHGFFEGILNQTIEINLQDNPYPETCLIRSLMMASKLRFAIGPKLAAYISHHSNKVSFKELQRIQESHYGYVKLDKEDLRSCFEAINSQLKRSKKGVVFLPDQQLKLEESAPKNSNLGNHIFKSLFSKIAEATFVHSRRVRHFTNPRSQPQRPAISVLNVPPHWLRKAS